MTALALSPAEAERLLAHVRSLEARVAELARANGALLHERDALAAKVTEVVAVTRTEPEITLYCDSCDCPPITRAVAPPEDAIPQWVRGLGWTCDGEGYRCPGCKR